MHFDPDPAPLTGSWGEALAARLAGHQPRQMDGGTRSAVMILLFEREQEARMILTKRSASLTHHPGQISLPGGRYEDGDGDLLRTALRETQEEIGVSPTDIRSLGSLDDVRTAASGFVLTPFVGLLSWPPIATPLDGEVARIMEVSLGELLALDEALPEAATLTTLRYPVQGEDVWGATARIIRDFCGHLRSAIGEGRSGR